MRRQIHVLEVIQNTIKILPSCHREIAMSMGVPVAGRTIVFGDGETGQIHAGCIVDVLVLRASGVHTRSVVDEAHPTVGGGRVILKIVE